MPLWMPRRQPLCHFPGSDQIQFHSLFYRFRRYSDVHPLQFADKFPPRIKNLRGFWKGESNRPQGSENILDGTLPSGIKTGGDIHGNHWDFLLIYNADQLGHLFR